MNIFVDKSYFHSRGTMENKSNLHLTYMIKVKYQNFMQL